MLYHDFRFICDTGKISGYFEIEFQQGKLFMVLNYYITSVFKLNLPPKTVTWVKPLFSGHTMPAHSEQALSSHWPNVFFSDYNKLQYTEVLAESFYLQGATQQFV